MRATKPGGLAGVELEWDERACVTVVLASRGYPATSSSGDVISGLEDADAGSPTPARPARTARSSPPAAAC